MTASFVWVDEVDPNTGASVKPDGKTPGEIAICGGCVMLGYLEDPEGTSRCMRNGYFYTGDIAVVHPDGYLEIKDRSKNVIISGGVNLNSVEVESILYGHLVVNEAAAVARPDEYWGETTCEFVSLKEFGEGKKKPTEKEMIEFCKERMPKYLVPKTSTGKIQKFLLRESATKLGPSTVSRM